MYFLGKGMGRAVWETAVCQYLSIDRINLTLLGFLVKAVPAALWNRHSLFAELDKSLKMKLAMRGATQAMSWKTMLRSLGFIPRTLRTH